MHCCGGSRQRGGDLVIGHAAKIVQLDDLGQARFHLQESFERVIQRDDIEIHGRRQLAGSLGHKIPEAGVALDTRARLGVVDQHPPHETRRQCEKMAAVLQSNIGLDQPQEGLMHHCGGLQRVAAPLAAHVVARQPA